MEKKKYFEVEAKCGHVGRTNYIPIKFAVVAENGKEAAAKVRNYPRVKHNHKDAILSVKSIDSEAFMRLKAQNDCDEYLRCSNVQEQRQIEGFDVRIEKEEEKVKATSCRLSLEYKRKKRALEYAKSCDDEYYSFA